MLANAMRNRLLGLDAEVREERRPRESVWAVSVHIDQNLVTVLIKDPDNRQFFQQELNAPALSSWSLVHTVAVLAREALSPRIPAQLRALPRAQVARPAAMTALPPAPEKQPWRLAAGVVAAAQWVDPGHALAGLGLRASLHYRPAYLRLALTDWTPVRATGTDYRLRMDLWSSGLGAGASFEPAAAVDVAVSAGLAWRFVRLRTAGDAMAFSRRTYQDWGSGAWLDAEYRLGHVGIGLTLAAAYYASSERVWVDGSPVLDLGSTQLLVALSCLLVL
jgi:hypothetical protein